MDNTEKLHSITVGFPEVQVFVKKSKKAKRVSLRVSGANGNVFLIVPVRVSMQDAENFACEKVGWIRKQLVSKVEKTSVQHGTILPIGGVPHKVIAGYGKKIIFKDRTIIVPFKRKSFNSGLKAFLIELARQRFCERTDYYTKLIGKEYSRIEIRDTKSRWGSCSAEGNISYSWRLILAPNSVLDYLVVHEVSHLVEMNHSINFWNHVETLMPNYKEFRSWLKLNGERLHSYQF